MIGVAALLFAAVLEAQEPRRVTVLYDAFGAPSDLERDWGFAALVEYGGKRILFDTRNDAAIFERRFLHRACRSSIACPDVGRYRYYPSC